MKTAYAEINLYEDLYGYTVAKAQDDIRASFMPPSRCHEKVLKDFGVLVLQMAKRWEARTQRNLVHRVIDLFGIIGE